MGKKKHLAKSCGESRQYKSATLLASPHEGSVYQLTFGLDHEGPLNITGDVLKRCPALARTVNPVGCFGLPTCTNIADVEIDAANVLIGYLYSGRYEANQWDGASAEVESEAAFITALRVWEAARKYEMPILSASAEKKIQQLGDRLSVEVVVNIMNSNNARMADECAWQPLDYLYERVRAFIHELSSQHSGLKAKENGQGVGPTILRAVADSMDISARESDDSQSFAFTEKDRANSITLSDFEASNE